MFCKNCGNRLEYDASYCQFCGNTVNQSEVINDSPVYETIKEECKHCNGSGKCGSNFLFSAGPCSTCLQTARKNYGIDHADVVECGICGGKGYHVEKYIKSKILSATSKNPIPPDNFITDIICPHCNKLMKANVPNTTPESSKYLNMSEQKCPHSDFHKVLVYRQRDGGYYVRKG